MTDSPALAEGGRPPLDPPAATRDATERQTARDPDRVAAGPRRFDPWFLGAALLFTAALAAAAYPAFRAQPGSGPGLLLLIGLAGVAMLGLFAFRGAGAERTGDLNANQLIDALEEPSALVAAAGRILSANGRWRAAGGDAPRLPRGRTAPAIFAAMAAARAGRPGRAFLVRLGEHEFEATVSAFPGGRFLVRAAAEGVLAEPLLPCLCAPSPSQAAVEPDTGPTPEEMKRRDAYAAGAPFSASAVLDQDDPFEGAIVEANATLQALAGGRAAPGARFADLLEPSSLEEARRKIASGSNGPIEVGLALEPPRAAHLYLAWDGGRRLVYVIDVSEQKQLELQIAQAGKMQAIGQLAGGVAHDFNNLLTAIQLRLDALLQRHPVGDPSYADLNETRQLGVRAADLVRNLLAFSRKQTVQRRTLDLGELISEFEVMLRRMLREDTKLETEYGRDLPGVRVDKSQLENAVMNLALNARDAMKAQGGGMVRIKTARDQPRPMRNAPWSWAGQAPGVMQEATAR